MHEIVSVDSSSSDCFDSIAHAMLKYEGFDHEAYSVKYFYTEYCSVAENRLMRGHSHNDELKNLFNVHLLCEDRSDLFDVSKYIDTFIQEAPVGIFIDSYECHWSPFYQKGYFSHCLLIVDVDEQNKKYLCFDVHFHKIGYVEVDFETIQSHFNSCFVFDVSHAEPVKLEVLLEKIHAVLDHYDSNIDLKTSMMFDYFTKKDIKELFPDDLATSIPLIQLMWIAEDKKHSAVLLQYIEKKLGLELFAPIYELLSNSSHLFSILRSTLVKYAMNGIRKEDKLKSTIRQIFENDDQMMGQMKTILREVNVK